LRIILGEKNEELSKEAAVSLSGEGGVIEPLKAVIMGGNKERECKVVMDLRSILLNFPFVASAFFFQNLDGVDVI
jgi:hypothetical protein